MQQYRMRLPWTPIHQFRLNTQGWNLTRWTILRDAKASGVLAIYSCLQRVACAVNSKLAHICQDNWLIIITFT